MPMAELAAVIGALRDVGGTRRWKKESSTSVKLATRSGMGVGDAPARKLKT